MDLFTHRIIENTKVEGPGVRTAIWFQGCSIHCKGCMIPETWPFLQKQKIDVYQLAESLIANSSIEGITILGGEPFDQHEALYTLVKEVKEKSDLSIMLFSGYTTEVLEKKVSQAKAILSMVDIFLEGPYINELTDYSREWVGSSNQKIHFLTQRYAHIEEEIQKDPAVNKVEVRIYKDGTVTLNGMIYDGDLSLLKP